MLLISWGENRARLSMLSSIVRIAVLPVAALRAAPSMRSGWSARSSRLWVAAGLNPGTREASGAVLATRALAQLGGEPLSEIERAWPPDVVLGVVVVVGLKARILARGVVGALDLEDQGHQRLGDEAAAEKAEVPGLDRKSVV